MMNKTRNVVFMLSLILGLTILLVIGTNFTNSIHLNNSPVLKQILNFLGVKQPPAYLIFNGINSQLRTGGDNRLGLNLTNEMTVSFWINPDSEQTQNYIIGKGNGTTKNPFEWLIWVDTNTTKLGVKNYTMMTVYGLNEKKRVSLLSHTGTAIPGKWNHIVYTVEGMTMNVFSDGVWNEVSSNGNISVDLSTSNNGIFIGKRDDSSSNYIGKIADIRIYNISLTNAEVKEVFEKSERGPDDSYFLDIMGHRVCPLNEDSTCILNTTLISIMDAVKIYNWTCITDKDLIDIESGKITKPKRAVMFVWDDGHKDSLEIAKIMQPYNCHSTFGIYTDAVGKESYMDWTEVKSIVETYGNSLASHSERHCSFDSSLRAGKEVCNTTETREGNLSASKSAIMKNTGYTPVSFIFPGNTIGKPDTQERTDIMNSCKKYYSLCYGDTPFTIIKPTYLNFNTNLVNGDIIRVAIGNTTELRDILNALIIRDVDNDLVGQWKTLEGQGNITYDFTGKENISWNNEVVWGY